MTPDGCVGAGQAEGKEVLQRRGTVCEAPASRGNARGLVWLGVVCVAWGGCPRRPGRDEVHLDQDGGRGTRERPADLAGSREFNQQGEVIENVVMCV